MLRELSSLQIYADHPVHQAAHEADVERLTTLLATRGADLNEQDGGGCTPLRRIVYRGTYYNATSGVPAMHCERTLACLRLVLDCPLLDMHKGKQVKWAIRSLYNDKYTHKYTLVVDMLDVILAHSRVSLATMFCPSLLPILFYNSRDDFDSITSRADFDWNMRTDSRQSPLSLGLYTNNRSVIKGRLSYTTAVLKKTAESDVTLSSANTIEGAIDGEAASPLTIAVHFHDNQRVLNANDAEDIRAHVKIVHRLLEHDDVDIHSLRIHEPFTPTDLNRDDYW